MTLLIIKGMQCVFKWHLSLLGVGADSWANLGYLQQLESNPLESQAVVETQQTVLVKGIVKSFTVI
jgi:hypothetical protein